MQLNTDLIILTITRKIDAILQNDDNQSLLMDKSLQLIKSQIESAMMVYLASSAINSYSYTINWPVINIRVHITQTSTTDIIFKIKQKNTTLEVFMDSVCDII